MSLGELSAVITVDDSQFRSGTRRVESSMRDVGSTVDRVGADMEQAMRSAARDMERQVSRAAADMESSLEDAGRRGGDGLAEGIESGLGGIDLDSAGDRVGADFVGGFRGAGVSGMAAAAGPIGAAIAVASVFIAAGQKAAAHFTDAFQQAIEQQDDLALMEARTGAIGAQSEEMGRAAGQLYAQGYGESFGDVTEAITGVTQNIQGMADASEAELARVGGAAMTVATVLDEDVGQTTRAVGQMMRTGLARDAEHAMDILTRGAQTGANAAGDLLDTFSEYSTQFRDLGLSADDAMGLMSQGLQAGARDSDTVADALKELRIRVVDLSASDALANLGLDAEEMASAFAEGGPKAREALDEILDGLASVEDPAERARLATDLFGTKAEDMAGAVGALDLSNAADQLGEVEGAADDAGDALHGTLGSRIESFKRTVKQSLVDFINDDVLPALDSFVEKMNLGEKFEEPINKTKDLWDDLKETFQEFNDEHGPETQENIDSVGEAFDNLSATVSAALDLVSALWEEWGDTILLYAQEKFGGIMQVINGALQFIQGIFEFFTGLVTGDWEQAMQGLETAAGGAWEAIKGLWRMATAEIVALAQTKFQEMKDKAKEKLDGFISDVKALPGRAKAAVGNLGTTLLQAGRDLVQGLINGLNEKIQALKDKAAEIGSIAADAAKSALGISSPSRVFRQIGHDVGDGLTLGLEDQMAAVVAAAEAIAASAIQPATVVVQQQGAGDSQSTAGGIRVDNVTVHSLGGQFSTRQVLEDVAWQMA